MYERKIPAKIQTGIDVMFYVVQGKWKRDIILSLFEGIKRPVDLQEHLAGTKVNSRVLNRQLKELEQHAIISKKVFPAVPPKVEYQLTEIGKDLVAIFNQMEKWGNTYQEQVLSDMDEFRP